MHCLLSKPSMARPGQITGRDVRAAASQTMISCFGITAGFEKVEPD
jgi:hypothetical protein